MTPFDDQDERLVDRILQTLRVEPSEAFVHRVMHGIYALPRVRPAFQFSWAFPALALSMAGFALTLFYMAKPLTVTSDAALLGDPVALSSAEEQIVDALVRNL